jgi:hypothetical protein
MQLHRPDADRRRRRLQLLAELADAKATRDARQPQVPARVGRLRHLVASRRRLLTTV